MKLKIKKEELLENFVLLSKISCEHLRVFVSRADRTMIAEVMSSYVPTETFISVFNRMSEYIGNNDIEKFIFDKRSLNAFNQPTMEWYYIEWKEEVYGFGVKKHRKLLPPQKWFKKCVEAGKDEIRASYPDSVVHTLDISYHDSIYDCLTT